MTERLTETLNWLYSLEARGEIYKLERMDNALELIGNPHLRLHAVHIAGTKGKGSVSAMLDSCLRAAGLRVGLYTKPHLVNLSERTRVDGAEISSRRMLGYIEKLRAIYEDAGLALTFFEFTVALMFLVYFADENVEVAVIETGPRRAPRFHQRGASVSERHHAHRFRSHGIPRLYDSFDRGREGRHHQAGNRVDRVARC